MTRYTLRSVFHSLTRTITSMRQVMARIPVGLRWLIGAFFILSLLYDWATPPLEASDELWHVGMVNAIATSGQLPVQIIGVKTAWEQEGSQPPLYYLLSAALVSGVDRGDFDALRQPNPHAIAGVPGAVGNKNLVLHDSPHPALQRTALAVYILRSFSIVLGCITICAMYAVARELDAPFSYHRFAILAAGLTAFSPMFLFITASVNNDNLVTALNSLIIWQTLVMLRHGFSTRRSLLLAILLALTVLSKLSGLVLLPIVFLAAAFLVYLAVRHRPSAVSPAVRNALIFALFSVIAVGVLAGWWYLRNLNLYGELMGTHTMAAVAGAREGAFTIQTLLNEFQGFRFGYWGVFGAFNIMTFRWFYDLMDIMTVIALGGLGLHLWHNRARRDYVVKLALLAFTVMLGAVSLIGWTAQTYASQGRLLFPYVAAISPLLALGLMEVFTRLRVNNHVVKTVPAAFALFALVVPIASIAPQYAPPSPLDHLPDSAQQVYARFGDVALIGYETPDRRYLPGDSVPVTLYWQVIRRSENDLSLYLHATLDDGSVIGKVDSYPGAGRLRTTMWQPNAIYADTYSVPLNKDAQGLSRLRVQVGWWAYPIGVHVPAADDKGKPLNVVMLNVGGFAPPNVALQTPDMWTPVQSVSFGGAIRLLGYQSDGNMLTLAWESQSPLSTNDTVFVQVLDRNNQVVGQGDAPPDLPTHYWNPGERFLTHHAITYATRPPSGDYRLIIGWYNPSENTRLSTDSPDNTYLLRTITLP
jgi:hypothetical protein